MNDWWSMTEWTSHPAWIFLEEYMQSKVTQKRNTFRKSQTGARLQGQFWTKKPKRKSVFFFITERKGLWYTDKRQCQVAMETERKRTKLSAIIFVFIFFCRSGNEYKNPGNKYGNRYYRKQILPETDTERIQSRYGNINRHWSELKNPLNYREIHTKTNKFNELLTLLQNNIIMLAT